LMSHKAMSMPLKALVRIGPGFTHHNRMFWTPGKTLRLHLVLYAGPK
jgi:hypothetical protein